MPAGLVSYVLNFINPFIHNDKKPPNILQKFRGIQRAYVGNVDWLKRLIATFTLK